MYLNSATAYVRWNFAHHCGPDKTSQVSREVAGSYTLLVHSLNHCLLFVQESRNATYPKEFNLACSIIPRKFHLSKLSVIGWRIKKQIHWQAATALVYNVQHHLTSAST